MRLSEVPSLPREQTPPAGMAACWTPTSRNRLGANLWTSLEHWKGPPGTEVADAEGAPCPLQKLEFMTSVNLLVPVTSQLATAIVVTRCKIPREQIKL